MTEAHGDSGKAGCARLDGQGRVVDLRLGTGGMCVTLKGCQGWVEGQGAEARHGIMKPHQAMTVHLHRVRSGPLEATDQQDGEVRLRLCKRRDGIGVHVCMAFE